MLPDVAATKVQMGLEGVKLPPASCQSPCSRPFVPINFLARTLSCHCSSRVKGMTRAAQSEAGEGGTSPGMNPIAVRAQAKSPYGVREPGPPDGRRESTRMSRRPGDSHPEARAAIKDEASACRSPISANLEAPRGSWVSQRGPCGSRRPRPATGQTMGRAGHGPNDTETAMPTFVSRLSPGEVERGTRQIGREKMLR